MNFWRKKRDPTCEGSNPKEQAVEERQEQERRSIKADLEFFSAMRRLALDASDVEGARFYETRIKDIRDLQSELEVMTNEDRNRNRGGK